ncbi:MAG: peptidase M28, partial [Chitinophagaceae bacterium]|nr:peptidase M28 [Chitinophagaceae bacterium]
MKPRLSLPILFLLLSPVFVFSQKKAELKKIETALRTHVNYLADDKLEGRRTGTAGEKLAMEYIAQQFQTIGLEAKGTE